MSTMSIGEFLRNQRVKEFARKANIILLDFSIAMVILGILILLFGHTFAFAAVAPSILI